MRMIGHLGIDPLMALTAAMMMRRYVRPDPVTLERWADDGGPIQETRDTPTPDRENLTRQQRRWRMRHPGRK